MLNPGTFELIKILKSMGFKIALLSSGFNFFIKRIFETDGVLSNDQLLNVLYCLGIPKEELNKYLSE
jgi:2-hydroxy-3-keto-5-methylthiopentenyl-1-phosphate phosphatase